MRILVDADDVLWDLLERWIEKVNEKFNLNKTIADCYEWRIESLFPTLTTKQIFSVLEAEDFWDNIRLFSGAKEYLKKLVDEGYDVVIVSSSTFEQVNQKFGKFFKKHFDFIPPENIIITKRKQLIKGDFLIDDYYQNLIGGEYTGILFTAHHNKDIDESIFGLCRCNSWKEIYDFIKESSRG